MEYYTMHFLWKLKPVCSGNQVLEGGNGGELTVM